MSLFILNAYRVDLLLGEQICTYVYLFLRINSHIIIILYASSSLKSINRWEIKRQETWTVIYLVHLTVTFFSFINMCFSFTFKFCYGYSSLSLERTFKKSSVVSSHNPNRLIAPPWMGSRLCHQTPLFSFNFETFRGHRLEYSIGESIPKLCRSK